MDKMIEIIVQLSEQIVAEPIKIEGTVGGLLFSILAISIPSLVTTALFLFF